MHGGGFRVLDSGLFDARESKFRLWSEIFDISWHKMRNLVMLVGVGNVVSSPGQVPDHVQLVLVDEPVPGLRLLVAAPSQLEFLAVPVLLSCVALLHLAVDGAWHLLSPRALVEAA